MSGEDPLAQATPADDLPKIVRDYVAAYNGRDVEGMLGCLADDVIFRNVSGGEVTAAAESMVAFAEMARAAIDLFSEREQTVVAAITVSNITVAQIAYRATIAQDMPNGWRVGEEITLMGRSLFEIEDGKICRLIDES